MKKCTKCKESKSLNEFGRHNQCKGCLSAYHKAWYRANKEKVQAKGVAWHRANPGYTKAYRQSNKEKIGTDRRAWKQANPEKVNSYLNRRRALKLKATVAYLPPTYRTTLFNFFGNRCMNPDCTKVISAVNCLTEDHVIPLSKGGHHAFYNLQVLCKSCNSSKQHHSTDDYRNGRMLLGAKDPKFNLWEYMEEHKQVIIRPGAA